MISEDFASTLSQYKFLNFYSHVNWFSKSCHFHLQALGHIRFTLTFHFSLLRIAVSGEDSPTCRRYSFPRSGFADIDGRASILYAYNMDKNPGALRIIYTASMFRCCCCWVSNLAGPLQLPCCFPCCSSCYPPSALPTPTNYMRVANLIQIAAIANIRNILMMHSAVIANQLCDYRGCSILRGLRMMRDMSETGVGVL